MILDTEAKARAYCAGLSDEEGLARLERLAELLFAENQTQNLVAKASEEVVWQRHFADSAQLLDHVPRGTLDAPWLDLGTGAGFPGLVIAALSPDRPCILVESRRKRADWLVRAASALGLANCRVEGRRLESLETISAAIISARAFAPMHKLIALSARFSTQDTVWLLPKGRSAGQEIAGLPEKVGAMFHVEQSVTDPLAGIVVGKGQPEIG